MSRRTSLLLTLVLGVSAASCGRSRDEHLARGKKYFDKQQYNEAIVEYLNAVQKDPRSGDAHMRLADAYYEAKNPGKALHEYMGAAELLPNNMDAQIKVASLLLIAGDFETAAAAADRALKLDPKSVTAQLIHANALAGAKKFDDAMGEMQKAIALDPTKSTGYADLGAIQLSHGDVGEAETNFKKAVEIDPDVPDTHISLATFFWSRNRLPEAEVEFRRAVEIDPRHVAANRALATFLMGTNRAAEAEQNLRAIAEATPTVAARLILADYYIAQKKTAEAVKLLNVVASTKEGYGEAKSRLAVLEYAAGRKAEAAKIIDEALVQMPSHPRALLTKAGFLLAEGNVDAALTRLNAAVLSDPRSADAHYSLGTIYALREEIDDAIREFNEILKINPSSVSAKMQLARLNLAQGQAALASDFAHQAVKAQPRDLGARALLVRTLISKNDLTNAEAELKPLLQAFPDRSQLRWLEGAIQLAKGQMEPARQSFLRSMQLAPDALEPLDSLVSLDLARNNTSDTRRLLEERLARRPNDSGLLVLAARVYRAQGELAKEEAVLRKAIEVDPSFRPPYGLLGELYFAQKRLDQALVEFQTLGRQDPKSFSVHTMVGVILQTQGKAAEAEESYKRALDLNPNAVIAANNLAWLYAEHGGNLDLALSLAQTAKAQFPDEPNFNDTLGWVYLKKNLPSLAIAPLRIAVDKAPRDPSYQYHLGLAYSRTGDTALARPALEAALKLDAKFENAADAKRVLQSLP